MDRLLSFNGPLSANIYMNAGNELEHHTQATKVSPLLSLQEMQYHL